MRVGYARISTEDQTLDPQLDALKSAGCERIFTDTLGGAKTERPGLTEALEFIRTGDALVVWKLDRLGRSLKNLIEIMSDLGRRGVTFISLTEQIDTSTSGGKLIFHVFGALAEFERDLIRERTKAGLAAARARGRLGGHPRVRAFKDPKQFAIARSLYESKQHPIREICQTFGVSRATLYRYLGTASDPALTQE